MRRRPLFGAIAVLAASFTAAVSVTAAVLAPTQPTWVRAFTRVEDGSSLASPRGVAMLANGDVALVDEQPQRILIVTPSGHLVRSFGGLIGNAPGQFANPAGVAETPAGDLVVVDRNNSRLQRFTAEGVVLEVIGGPGTGPGQFQQPSAIAIAPNGDWFVSDQGNHRIVHLSPSGSFIAQWGAQGSGNGEFQYPSGIAIDRHGDIYVTDLYNDRVQKFTMWGTWIRSWGTTGNANGQFLNPAGIAVDALGTVFVGETGGHRIQRFTDRGQWVATIIGSNYGTQATSNAPTGMVASGAGQLFVAEYLSKYLQRFEYLPPPPVSNSLAVPVATASLTGIAFPDELTCDDQGGAYVMNLRLVVFRISAQGSVIGSWNADPAGPHDSFHPSAGIAFHAGRVYATDPANGVVRVFERDGTPAGTWGNFPPTVPGGTWYLSAIQIDASGVVSIQSGKQVEHFDLNGQPLGGTITLPPLTYEGRLDVAPDGQLWNPLTSTVEHRSANGTLLSSFPTLLPIPSNGAHVHFSTGRGLYVADGAGSSFRLFDESGNVLGTQTLPPGPLGLPTFIISFDGDALGNLWIGDAQAQLVMGFTTPPIIETVQDVAADQGGQVTVRFQRSPRDVAGVANPVTQYLIFRKLDGVVPPDADPSPLLPGWEQVLALPATQAASYTVSVPTRQDAIPSAQWQTTFLVRAALAGGQSMDSPPMTGFSLDNLAPDAPTQVAEFEGAGSSTLYWQPGAVAGTRYRIHRDASPAFEPHEGNVIAETTGLTFTDNGVTGATYAIEAMDDAENLSATVKVNAAGVLGVPGSPSGAEFALRRLAPNPSDGTRLSVDFALASAEPVRLEVFDASGRRVHDQRLQGLAAGPHSLVVQPARRLATGVYVLRLSSRQQSRQLRMLVVR